MVCFSLFRINRPPTPKFCSDRAPPERPAPPLPRGGGAAGAWAVPIYLTASPN